MHVRRPVVAVGLVGSVVALAAAPAVAAAGHTTTYHDASATNQSDVLRLTLSPPSGAALPLPSGFPSSLDLGVLDVRGTSLSKPKTDNHAATAFSGLISPTGTQLDQATSNIAASANEKKPSATLPGNSFPSNPVLDGSAVTGLAKVLTSTDGSTSDISIANLSVLKLGSILPASAFASLQSGLTTLTGSLNSVVASLDALSSVPVTLPTGSLPTLPVPLPTTLTDIPGIVAQIQSFITELGNLPTSLQKTALITLKSLDGSQSVTHGSHGAVTSKATTTLGDLNVLAGLLHITAVKTSASATAAGVAGSAKATSAATVGTAKLGTSGIVATLGAAGKVVSASIPGLPTQDAQALSGALDTVTTALQGVLNMVGLSFSSTGTTTKHVAANGRSASSEADGITVSFAPPASPLSTSAATTSSSHATAAPKGTVLSLSLGRSVASVTAAKTVRTVAATPHTVSHAASPLPDTGGTATPAVVGSALLGLAGVTGLVRRRRRSAA